MGVRKACRFPRSLLGPCSGIEDREFGFKDGKPCFIVKLNRIVNFRPKVILNEYVFQLLVLSVPHFSTWHFTCHLWLHHLDRDIVSRMSARIAIRSQSSSRITAASFRSPQETLQISTVHILCTFFSVIFSVIGWRARSECAQTVQM